MKHTTIAALATAALWLAAPAHAVMIDGYACSDPSSAFTNLVECGDYIETRPGNDAGGPLTIDGVEYVQLAKYEADDEKWEVGGGAGYSVSGIPGNWGRWSLPFDALFLVIKAGSGASGGGFSIYSLGPDGASSGEWATAPTLLDGEGLGRYVSHLSWYGRGGSTEVPEPGTLALLGAGLFGLGFARRRRAA